MPTPKLLDLVRNVARMRHLSLSTERAYVGWIRRFILFHHKKHPKDMAEKEIREFISDLAVNAKISASTHPLHPVPSRTFMTFRLVHGSFFGPRSGDPRNHEHTK